jgi:hypothetical protein
MTAEWDGVTKASSLKEWAVAGRQELADAARDYDWPKMLAILAEHPNYINAVRLEGKAWYAPLHQAAHGGAPLEVVQQLIAMGAWRSLPTADGERPVDIAGRRGYHHLLTELTPVYRRQVPPNTLAALQAHFHAVIRGRAEDLVNEHHLRLPELGPLLEIEEPQMWFPVPGMYGGFSYWLAETGREAKLISESWSRVVGGSGQRHEITTTGSALVAEGFV